ncbi:DNA repair/transcription protein Mms19 [Phaffia rhodozyma]|uniref:MMS19 nucleotide excision repair protein n=1 Tax=Phaffia rhodozyma TaxID=264483 RepID=A0A0F7SHR4_PHARH|nr:DNA repair/transcription protein Mms19 [Phaffia rhodozyma]
MEDTERVVRTYISTGASQVPVELLQLLDDSSVSLLGVVKALGEYLTSPNEELRVRALGLLSGTLSKLSPAKINRQSTRVLSSFYCDKLEDLYVISPALQGLCVLSSLPTFGSGETVQVCEAIFAHIKMKSLMQAVRFLVFKAIDILMAKHRDALKKMGSPFVAKYCQIADGEKDPRNLLLAFSIARVILVEFEIEPHAEELFDVTFCYFPITYKPPPNDPYGISSDDLRNSLRSCLCGTPLFAKHAMPLLLDKLTASGGDMKKDVLRTLASCLVTFGQGNAVGQANEIWEALKVEILFTSDIEMETEALLTLEAFFRTVYPSSDDRPSGIVAFIVEQCLQLISEPEKSKAQPATRILASCFHVSSTLGVYAYSQAVPQLLSQFYKTEDLSQRGPILEALTRLLYGARELYGSPDSGRTLDGDQVLRSFKDELVGCFTAGIGTSLFKRPALEGFMQIVQIEGYLDEEETGFVVQKINDLILAKEAEDIRGPALIGLTAISKSTPKAVSNITLPLLFNNLTNTAPPFEDDEGRDQYRRILSCLVVLCVEPALFSILVDQLMDRFERLCFPSQGPTLEDDPMDKSMIECRGVYAFALLNCLWKVIKSKVAEGHTDIPDYQEKILYSLFRIFIVASVVEQEGEIARNTKLIVAAAQLEELLVQTLNIDQQSEFAKKAYAAFFEEDPAALMNRPVDFPLLTKFSPMKPDAPEFQKNMVILLSSAAIALRPQCALPIHDFSNFVSSVLVWSLNTASSQAQSKSMFHLFGQSINKFCDQLGPFFKDAVPEFWETEVVNVSAPVSRRNRSIRGWVWLCRSLLVRSHELGFKYLDQFLRLLMDETNESLAWEAARALAIIAEGDGEGVFTKRNHTIIRLLHKQKIFNFVLPKLVQGYTDSKGSSHQRVFLVALASIIRIIPRSLCVAELFTLFPLLLQSLDLPDPELKANVMETILELAQVEDQVAQDAVEKQAGKIVEGLLRALDKSRGSNERSRSVALMTLAAIPDIVRYDILHSFKPNVLRVLGTALDDKRRNVRKEAVDCRARWFLYHG